MPSLSDPTTLSREELEHLLKLSPQDQEGYLKSRELVDTEWQQEELNKYGAYGPSRMVPGVYDPNAKPEYYAHGYFDPTKYALGSPSVQATFPDDPNRSDQADVAHVRDTLRHEFRHVDDHSTPQKAFAYGMGWGERDHADLELWHIWDNPTVDSALLIIERLSAGYGMDFGQDISHKDMPEQLVKWMKDNKDDFVKRNVEAELEYAAQPKEQLEEKYSKMADDRIAALEEDIDNWIEEWTVAGATSPFFGFERERRSKEFKEWFKTRQEMFFKQQPLPFNSNDVYEGYRADKYYWLDPDYPMSMEFVEDKDTGESKTTKYNYYDDIIGFD